MVKHEKRKCLFGARTAEARSFTIRSLERVKNGMVVRSMNKGREKERKKKKNDGETRGKKIAGPRLVAADFIICKIK